MLQHPRSWLLVLLIVGVLGSLTACDSGGASEEEVNNEFELQVAPAASGGAMAAQTTSDTTLGGYTFFYGTGTQDSQTSPTGDLFILYFNGTDAFEDGEAVQQGLFGFANRFSTRPSPGTYSIAPPGSPSHQDGTAFSFFITTDYDDVQQRLFPYTYFEVYDGTIEINDATNNVVTGTFDAMAEKVTIESTGDIGRDTVSVTGPFTAENVETFVQTGAPSS